MTPCTRPAARGAGPRPAPFPGLVLGLGLLALALHALPGAAAALALDREAVAAGELWRLLSGHWVHWSTQHLLWDVGTFVALGIPCELRSRNRLAACVLGACLAISAVVWWALPGLSVYAGLSGVDCALFACLGAELWRERRGGRAAPAVAALLALALVLKVGFEWATGSTLFVAQLGDGIAPVPAAHLAGAGIGLAIPVAAALGARAGTP